jgi:hypothetical protein
MPIFEKILYKGRGRKIANAFNGIRSSLRSAKNYVSNKLTRKSSINKFKVYADNSSPEKAMNNIMGNMMERGTRKRRKRRFI